VSLQFKHYTVNDTVESNREFPLAMNEDTVLTAHYEAMKVNVKIKNEETSNKKIIKITILTEEIIICPGDTVEIQYNPETDVLILKPAP